MNLFLPAKPYNMGKLDEELRSGLGEALIGVSSGGGQVWVILAEAATPVHQDQALAIANAHDAAQRTASQNTFENVKTGARSAEGIALSDLTAGQVKALLAVILYRAGGVSTDGKVRPLNEWVG
jgi:hypothetical protein